MVSIVPVPFMIPWFDPVVGVVCCVGDGAGVGAGAGDWFPSAVIIVLSLLATLACCLAISALSCAINDASPWDAPAIDPVSTENTLITLLPNSWKLFGMDCYSLQIFSMFASIAVIWVASCCSFTPSSRNATGSSFVQKC